MTAPPSNPELTVVVVSYNTREMTLECLRSLSRETAGIRFETIVVDNASDDGSADAIAREFPSIRLVRSDTNLGFAGANNLAARHARAELILLLNPDTVVLDSAVERLVAFARRTPEAGIWGGRTLFADRSLNPTSCWGRQTLWSVFCRASGLTGAFPRSPRFNPEALAGWDRNTEREVDIVTGCFFLIRASLWKDLCGFDPTFFMYGEEADLCLRARSLGARPRFTPEATIVHYGGASERIRAEKLIKLLRAKAQLIRRHWTPIRARLGVWLLAAWCRTHALAWGVKRRLRHEGAKETHDFWLAGWSRRREWMGEPAIKPAPNELPDPKRAVNSGGLSC